MAKPSAKKPSGKKPARSAEAAKPRPTAAGATAMKQARAGDADHVSFGIHGMARILNAVKDAGLESKFNEEVGKSGTFVKVSREGMKNIHKFVHSNTELASVAGEMSDCDCPPNDPYCIYFLP